MIPPQEQEVYRPRKLKWALVLLGSAGFAVGGYFMARDPDGNRFWGYFCLVFFGICAIVSLIQFLPNNSSLRLTPQGLTLRTMWRTTFYRWSDIERFGVAEWSSFHARHRLVGFDFSERYPDREKATTLKNLNRNLTGFEAALPDNYGWDYAELAAYLNAMKERYAGRGEG